jgi:hypothetical protein
VYACGSRSFHELVFDEGSTDAGPKADIPDRRKGQCLPVDTIPKAGTSERLVTGRVFFGRRPGISTLSNAISEPVVRMLFDELRGK